MLLDKHDLIRRLIVTLELAEKNVNSITQSSKETDSLPCNHLPRHFQLLPKISAETAMLLVFAKQVCAFDKRIPEFIDTISGLLIPIGRSNEIRSAIILEPGLARDHAITHILLNYLGHPDEEFDLLLKQSLAIDHNFGPERLPHRKMEQEWLDRILGYDIQEQKRSFQVISDSILGRPMDVLGSSRLDIYAFTHSLMYATDLGQKSIRLPRRRSLVISDAEALLAFSLETNDFDLTAELLLTWPLLKIAWSPSALLALRILARIEDRYGFLPGLAFDPHCYNGLKDKAKSVYVLETSYHTIYVMGFLCAAALKSGYASYSDIPFNTRSRGIFKTLMDLFDEDEYIPCWKEEINFCKPAQQDSVYPLILTTLLRRARNNKDLKKIKTVLEVALSYNQIREPAINQALGLLSRSQFLNGCT